MSSDKLIYSLDPRTGESVEVVAESMTKDQVATVCHRSAKVADSLAALSGKARATVLDGIANLLDSKQEYLVPIADRETALGVIRLEGELKRTTNQLRLFADVLREGSFQEAIIDHADAGTVPPRPDLRRILRGVGPVAVFGSSNFPFAFSVAGGDTASALAAGCPVIVKAHSSHPALSTRVAEVIRQGLMDEGVDQDVLQIVFGHEAGQWLVQNSFVKAVGFTGSESGGRALMDLASDRIEPIPVYAEMSSLNPVVVSPLSVNDPDALVSGLADSILLGHGQFCTKPGLVFLPDTPSGNRFTEALKKRLVDAGEAVMLSNSIRDSFAERTAQVGSLAGVTSLLTPLVTDSSGAVCTPGLARTSAAYARKEPAVMKECFGPATLIVSYRDLDDLLTAVGAVPGSLTFSIHFRDEEEDFISPLIAIGEKRSGRIIFNGFPTGVSVTWAQHHAGPYPATSTPLHTSVGATAIRRFLSPIAYQNCPERLLPVELRDENPLAIPRRMNGVLVAPSNDGRHNQ